MAPDDLVSLHGPSSRGASRDLSLRSGGGLSRGVPPRCTRLRPCGHGPPGSGGRCGGVERDRRNPILPRRPSNSEIRRAPRERCTRGNALRGGNSRRLRPLRACPRRIPPRLSPDGCTWGTTWRRQGSPALLRSRHRNGDASVPWRPRHPSAVR